ncbi:hypothetical protein [Sphingobacterium deserti]|uniref:Flexirubin-type pigment biosynthesis acyl carrier protein DarC1 n=1 Tax=Sphingobacterium deserti TaxID=1229276 RepID=A0A0B8T212_9SPHI|nr:hypothetical protein [Sphingobacterium deserti]KGE14851.1 flexirubin-type pigment biosynthesis acyl carrier protein DarC1 [Sphingobacterium deserti]
MSLPLTGPTLLNLIPQRPPMVMVSSLESYSESDLTSSFLVEAANILVEENVLVESGLLEHMAQSVALHTGYGYYLRGDTAPVGYIGAMQQVEILALPAVGQRIYTDVQILQEFMGVTLVEIITKLDEVIIAKSQMKTVIAGT